MSHRFQGMYGFFCLFWCELSDSGVRRAHDDGCPLLEGPPFQVLDFLELLVDFEGGRIESPCLSHEECGELAKVEPGTNLKGVDFPTTHPSFQKQISPLRSNRPIYRTEGSLTSSGNLNIPMPTGMCCLGYLLGWSLGSTERLDHFGLGRLVFGEPRAVL